MATRALITLLGVALALALSASATPGSQAQSDLQAPLAPLAMAAGQSVVLAWQLPARPRPDTVVIYRSEKTAEAFEELARVESATLGFTDEKVELGRAYQYRLAMLRGAAASPMSGAVEVLVGGTARMTLRGGSTDRAVFDVTVFRGGRRLTSAFSHSPGEKIGDLVHVPELARIEDFRLGVTLRELSLSRARSETTSRLALQTSAGESLKDLAGNPIQADFRFPGSEREILTAAIQLADGRIIALAEGVSFTVP